MKSAARIAGMFSIFYFAYVGFVYSVQDGMVFPGTELPAPTWSAEPPIERWVQKSGNVVVEAIWAPHPDATEADPRPLLVFLHGNGGLADHSVPTIPTYHRLGFNVLVPEYRGYGRSTGEPSETAIVADALAFVERAAALESVDANRLIYHGQSLGGGVASAMAARRPPAALVLESTFTAVSDFSKRLLTPPFLAKHPFDTASRLPKYPGPILLSHAREDPVVPFEMGEELARIGKNVQFEVYEGSAHMLPPAGEQRRYWTTMRDFFADHGLTDN